MTDPLEQALARTLTAKADDAPAPVSGLADRATLRARKRRRARWGTAAVVAALLAGGIGWGALNPTDVKEVHPIGHGDETLGGPAPVEQLWPGAVHRVKAVPPEDVEGDWAVISVIDTNRLLISWPGQGTRVRYAAYTPETGQVAEMPSLDWGPGRPNISQGYALWTRNTEEGSMEVTASVLPDGPDDTTGISVISVRSDVNRGDRVGVADGRLYWETSEGVFTRPIATLTGTRGGPPEGSPSSEPTRVAAEGNRIVQWPWVSRLDGSRRGPIFGTIRNVETGEIRKAVLPAPESGRPWVCGVVWCLADGEVRKRDGSMSAPNPVHLAPRPPKDAKGASPATAAATASPDPTAPSNSLGGPTYNRYSQFEPVLDRFLFQGDADPRVLVKDLVTGRTGLFSVTAEGLVHGKENGRADRYVVQPTEDGYLFLDLAAIG
ncbi:hypothetical protein EDD29_0185 [Actinocorallia herbida]|uniref:Uncharacterized protein n=1 Tax=Actinocorallia herbida TaxID=58109 RepID=A0A3N1CN44_9ACTN|nr:hypothetical protein [Actinocorallia herbida]ROO82703.1 hypothetical protein EDD29_0185 [Actinocorallia herbida]